MLANSDGLSGRREGGKYSNYLFVCLAACVVAVCVLIAMYGGKPEVVSEETRAAQAVAAKFGEVKEFEDSGHQVGSGEYRERKVTEADYKTAFEIVEALCKGDLPSLQAVIDRHEHKPYTLGRVIDVVDRSMHKAGGKYMLLCMGQGVFIEGHDAHDGDFLLFVNVKKAPIVSRWLREGNGYGAKPTNDTTAEEVLRSMGREITENVNSGLHSVK